jgi:hypothetical protein
LSGISPQLSAYLTYLSFRLPSTSMTAGEDRIVADLPNRAAEVLPKRFGKKKQGGRRLMRCLER